MKSLLKRTTTTVYVGSVAIGTDHPIVVQSMTNIPTADIVRTVRQIKELVEAGAEIIRITVDTKEAASAVPKIYEQLEKNGYQVPLVGDFHFNGDRLLRDCSECAKVLAKYRINPGNVNNGGRGDKKFDFLIEQAIKNNRPVRIGVNWGSLDKKLLSSLMQANQKRSTPQPSKMVLQEALIKSTLDSAQRACQIGLAKNKIILSCKVSNAQSLIAIYRKLAKSCDYPLHLGLTEAGLGYSGVVASVAALSILLQEGIGETIRVSLTPEPGQSRKTEVDIAQAILQALDLRRFKANVTACPGCGRTTSQVFQTLAIHIQSYLARKMPVWQKYYKNVEHLHVAVMGCVVNGPGESKLANIGISLPGIGENSSAPVYVDGKKVVTLHGNDLATQFERLIEAYVMNTYAKK